MTFVDDSTQTLGTDAIGRINSANSSLDLKVVVASTGNRAELDQMVGRLVNSANTVAIGVDPIHRYTFTHFGTGTGISSADYQTIARAGNGEFKAGHWEQGIEAIIASANAASVRTAARSSVIVQQPVTVVEHPVSAWPFVAGGVGFCLAAVLLVRWLKRRQADQALVLDGFREEAAQMRARNVEEQGWHDKFKAQEKLNRKPVTPPPAKAPRHVPAPPIGKSQARRLNAQPPSTTVTFEEQDRIAYERTLSRYRQQNPAPAPEVHHHYDNSASNLALGYMIGNATAPRVETIVEVRPERHRADTPAPSSSSSSDWGSSSSSSDSGSGGGGFDSGGGGGFDGGSGGGDF